MDRAHGIDGAGHGEPHSVVIDDLDIGGAAVRPDKTHPPLTVDTDAVLASAVSLQGFQPVSGWAAQKVERLRGIQKLQLAFRRCPDGPEWTRIAAFKQRSRVATTKGLDHAASVLRWAYNVKR